MREVYAFGDSHWRLFFPFTNHGAPGPRHQEGDIVTIDTTANELSGATMWGLQNPNSRHGARNRILNTIDAQGGVENVGLVFGEVDVRFHWGRYFKDNVIDLASVYRLLAVYRDFIDNELLRTKRVRGLVFVYYGFRYNPEQPEWQKMRLHRVIEELLPIFLKDPRIVTITPGNELEDCCGDAQSQYMCADGVHPLPETIFPEFVLPVLKEHLK